MGQRHREYLDECENEFDGCSGIANVEIEWFNVDGFCRCKYFIDSYSENCTYRLKHQYPIFRRNEDGEVFRQDSKADCQWVLNKNTDAIGNEFREYNDSTEIIPYDNERGLYHLQPVWCWDNTLNNREVRFFNCNGGGVLGVDSLRGNIPFDNIEPITPEQLKTMPFIWDMYYKKVLWSNR